MTTTFIICPTYRNPNKANITRLFGPVMLLEQMKQQDYDGTIKIAIIDSSPTPHPFFAALPSNVTDNFIYLHLPDRNDIDHDTLKKFPQAMSFIPDDDALKLPVWQQQVNECVAWDNIFPYWSEGYPYPTTIAQQIAATRPTIGMKRNAAIAALAETYGPANAIVYADDDDLRDASYVRELANNLESSLSFTRVLKQLVYISKDSQAKWGVYDVDLECDANGNWLPPKETKHVELKNLDPNYKSTIGEELSEIKCLAFPPIGFQGATHAYSFGLWEKAVKEFGGVPITSMSEDTLFYLNCKNHFGKGLTTTKTVPKQVNFVRICDGANASVVQWTDDLQPNQVPKWAIDAVRPIENAMSSVNFDAPSYFRNLAHRYLQTGQILWSGNNYGASRLTLDFN